MKNMYVLAVVLGMVAVQSARADGGVSVGVDARVRYEGHEGWSGSWRSDLIAEDVNVTVNAQLAEKIRAHIRLILARLTGHNWSGDAIDELEKALEEATIEIREVNGTPIAAVIFGKQKIAFGASDRDMPGFRDSLLYDLMTRDEVIGLTVELKEVLGFAIAASAFENEAGDLQFGEGWGFSLAASRQLTENLRARGSILAQQDGSSDDFSDRRATVGLVYQNDKGGFTATLDALYFEGQTDCDYPDSGYGVQAGVATQLGVGTVRVQASYLQDTAYQVAASYDVPVTDSLVVSPYVRYTTDENGDNGSARAGVEARVRMGDNSNNSVR